MAARRRKRRLKKSFKIFMAVCIAVIIAAGFSFYNYRATHKPIVPYGHVSGEGTNEEYGKVKDPDDTEENSGDPLSYYVFDVGKGYSIFISYKGTHILMDAGDRAHGKAVVKKIRAITDDKTLDYVIATNATEERIGGLLSVYKAFSVKHTILPKESKSKAYARLLNAVNMDSKSLEQTNIDVGSDATLSVYDVTKGAEDDKDRSAATLLTFGDTTFLTTGDLSEKYEARLGDRIESVNVYIAGDYGSSRSNQLLKNMQPGYVAISCASSGYGFSKSVISLAGKQGATVLATCRHGDIKFMSDGSNVESNKDGKTEVSPSDGR